MSLPLPRRPAPGYDAPLAERVRYGLTRSGPIALAGAVLYAIAVLLGGENTLAGAPLTFSPAAWGTLIGIALSGAIFYGLRPWHRHRAGAALAGAIAAFPSAYYFVALISAEPALDPATFAGRLGEAILLAGVGGALFGNLQWQHDRG